MRIVIFGLTLSSSWGNGHATLWRGLLKALAQRGHTAIFYEKDVPYYANARDGYEPPPGITLRIYPSLEQCRSEMSHEAANADVALVTSYCPDGARLSELVLESGARAKLFYDLDTPVTLDSLNSGQPVAYLPDEGLAGFDLVLSYTGGRALDELRTRLGARRVEPLYGWVDPGLHSPAAANDAFRAELSYLGTFAADRQAALVELFAGPAKRMPRQRFVIGGAQYPQSFPWLANMHFVRHLEPTQHAAFFCSCRATLNVTRRAMSDYGWCPSGRLFEAAACGAPVLTDVWEGLGAFFSPGQEILPVRNADDVVNALSMSDAELRAIARAGRERALAEHTAARRVLALEAALDRVDSTACIGA